MSLHRPLKKERLPDWLVRRGLPSREGIHILKKGLRRKGLHTVCEEAMCPNLGECWAKKTATFMILGDTCTRHCGFCAMKSVERAMPSHCLAAPSRGVFFLRGSPPQATITRKNTPLAVARSAVPLRHPLLGSCTLPLPDPREPENVARMIKELNLKHAVITSVTRDDLPDGGAGHFAATIEAVRRKNPSTTIEVLTPDFLGNPTAIRTVLNARPEIFNHNVETVRRLTPKVRDKAEYERSLEVLRVASKSGDTIRDHVPRFTIRDHVPRFKKGTRNEYMSPFLVKSGFMVGLGETKKEVEETLNDLREAGCNIVTIGQYLRPGRKNIPVVEYVPPSTFDYYRDIGYKIGFKFVASAPLVRSSYKSGDTIRDHVP